MQKEMKLPIRAAPYRHQVKAADYALKRLAHGGGAALLMEMGTGKTIAAIAITGALWEAGYIQRLLVVAPLFILGVWEDEFRNRTKMLTSGDAYQRFTTEKKIMRINRMPSYEARGTFHHALPLLHLRPMEVAVHLPCHRGFKQ